MTCLQTRVVHLEISYMMRARIHSWWHDNDSPWKEVYRKIYSVWKPYNTFRIESCYKNWFLIIPFSTTTDNETCLLDLSPTFTDQCYTWWLHCQTADSRKIAHYYTTNETNWKPYYHWGNLTIDEYIDSFCFVKGTLPFYLFMIQCLTETDSNCLA